MHTKRLSLALLCCVTLAACRDTTEGIRTQFVGSYAFSATERRTIARVAGAVTQEVRRHLPALPPQIVLEVQSGDNVIPELGATAAVAGAASVTWTVNPGDPRGVVSIAESHLRAALFHEFHHLVRLASRRDDTVMDAAITEGMATAFERDFAGVSPPWGQYPDDVTTWVEELLALPPTARRADWIYRHPDGRRWIGMRAGTYLVDQAMKKLQRTSADLVATPAAEILAAAGVGQATAPAPGAR